MKKIRTEKQTTPVGQEIETEWFSGTPEEAEKLLRDGECDGIEFIYNGKRFLAINAESGAGFRVWRSRRSGDEDGPVKQIKRLSDFFPVVSLEMSPTSFMTI